jgi:hypothetical protein
MDGYVEYGGNFFPKQPYKSEGILAHLFVLPANRDAVQALVDRTLNLPQSKTTYLAVAPVAMATFMKMENLTSLDPVDCNAGIYRENELSITVPLLACEEVPGLGRVPRRIVFHMPYLWVDAGTVMIAGREVYGFPKQLGDFQMPDAFGAPADFQVAADVITHFSPTSRVAREPVLRVRRTDAPHTIESALSTTGIVDFCERIINCLGLEPAMKAMLKCLPQPELTFAFLKQFRDAANGNLACYQSVVEAHAPITRIGRGDLLKGDFELEIFHHDSMRLAQELFGGVPPDGVRLTPILAARFDFDFVINFGESKWVAPQL